MIAKQKIIFCTINQFEMNLKFIIPILFIMLPSQIYSQIPDGYYNGTENLKGEELKNALYQIIKGHTEFYYTSSSTDVWDILKETDKDPNNSEQIILLYTGWSVNAAQEWNDGNGWNREHVWAKSHGDFGTDIGPGTDVHALRPTDPSVNEARWNYDFAEGGDIYVDPDGETNCRKTSNSWEPWDEVKGDVARMLFYMGTRYEGENGEPDLELVDNVNSSPNKEPLHGKLSDLIKWHEEDPVDDWERNRNDIIYYDYQHNRNPFIDHPEFVGLIYDNLSTFDEEVRNQENIKIYPNPAKDFIAIEFKESRNLSKSIQLFDLSGKENFSAKTNSSIYLLYCSNFKSGYYFLKVVHENKILLHKKIFIE